MANWYQCWHIHNTNQNDPEASFLSVSDELVTFVTNEKNTAKAFKMMILVKTASAKRPRIGNRIGIHCVASSWIAVSSVKWRWCEHNVGSFIYLFLFSYFSWESLSSMDFVNKSNLPNHHVIIRRDVDALINLISWQTIRRL